MLRSSRMVLAVLLLGWLSGQATAGLTCPEILPRDYTLKEMEAARRGEDTPDQHGRSVTYLRTAQEREPYRLQIRNGLVYDHEGKLYDTAKWGKTIPVFGLRDGDIVQVGTREIPGVAIFVMDANGNIFAGEGVVGTFHHSTFVAGGPIAAAGEMRIVRGRIEMINNNSGHYKPAKTYTDQVVRELQTRGVDISPIELVEIK